MSAPQGPLAAVLARSGRPVVLSPHLDDGVLCLGGTLSWLRRHGAEPVVVTVFAGSGALQSELQRSVVAGWGAPYDVRREDDAGALGVLDCDWVHLAFEESLFRHPGATTFAEYLDPSCACAACTGVTTAATVALDDVLADLRPDVILLPGSDTAHLDHRLTRVAFAASTTVRSSVPVIGYEELPYAFSTAPSPSRQDVSRFEALDLDRKLVALARYASQVAALSEGTEPLLPGLRTRARRLAGRSGGGEALVAW